MTRSLEYVTQGKKKKKKPEQIGVVSLRRKECKQNDDAYIQACKETNKKPGESSMKSFWFIPVKNRSNRHKPQQERKLRNKHCEALEQSQE